MILIDAHVHFYNCYSIKGFLDAGGHNFARAAKQFSNEEDFSAFMMLAENGSLNWFHLLKDFAEGKEPNLKRYLGSWNIKLTADGNALWADKPKAKGFFIIAGRQIITMEGIEILALATDASFEDGKPANTTILSILEESGIAVLPWSFGKWLGNRGKVLRRIIYTLKQEGIFLGDICGRPYFWPKPNLFKLGADNNIPIISGSDPLPLSFEEKRVGSFGTVIREQWDGSQPSVFLKKLLKRKQKELFSYGISDGLIRFFLNQFLLRISQLCKRSKQQLQSKLF